jgi:U4/U6.U5 tri-snRNP-associated protein 1
MGGDDAAELSLSEANALRIKLGLQPLGPKASTKVGDNVHSRSINQNDQAIVGVERDEWGRIIVPTENLGDKKQEDKIKEKIEVRKQKREAERLLRVKTLGASTKPMSRKRKVDIEEDGMGDEDDLDMVDWLSTQTQESKRNKRKYEKMEKFYSDQDKAANEKVYNENDLVGMKIGHDIADIDEETDMILTLKDKRILDEDAVKDVLTNVNILDMESARTSIKNKKQGLDYNPWEDDADDMLEDMMSFGKHSKTLKKYDEIIYGNKDQTNTFDKGSIDSFAIGKDGEVDLTDVKKREALKADLFKNTQSLGPALAEYEPTSDFMTAADFKRSRKTLKDESLKKEPKDELSSKAPKIKKSKKMKPLKLTARDLLNQANSSDNGNSDFYKNSTSKFNSDRKRANQSNRRRVEEDEFDKVAFNQVKKNEKKLGRQLLDAGNKIVKKAKKPKSKKMFVDREEFMESIARERQESESEEEFDVLGAINDTAYKKRDDNKDGLVMTKTEEFCRNIQLETTDRRAKNKKKTKEEEFKQEEEENDYGASKISVDHVGQLIGVKEEDDIGTGMASFLKMAKEKCVLDEVEDTRKLALQVSKHVKDAIVANPDSYSILEDRFRFDHDIDRLGHRRLGKFDGSGTSRNFEEFSEKNKYKPTFKLSYTDKDGAPLTQKEAFRELSHKFHGKTSGKVKTDKRQKKKKEKQNANKRVYSEKSMMNDMLQAKQAESKQPFVILAGQEGSIHTMTKR